MKKKLSLLLLLFPFAAMAATTWIGSATITIAAWNTPGNWSSGAIPTPSEQITFNTAVTITENVPVTTNNNIVIQNIVTINSSVTITTGDVSIDGGTIINNGKLTAHNMTYSNAGGIVTNNGTINLNQLNVGNATYAGTFTNNGTLSSTNNIVIEEGTFNNNSSATVNTNGIAVRNGGAITNKGTLTSAGTTSTAQISIDAGGVFTNDSGGVLNVNLNPSSVYAINSQGTFTNIGTTKIGSTPYFAGSKGILAGSGSNFSNTGSMVFNIDPANCVITNNTGGSGSFSSAPVTINSGSACGSVILPITLISFFGQATEGFNTISWVTGEELNFAKYELEQSSSGTIASQWNTIATIAPSSNHTYQYKDYTTMANSFYRLKIIDNNGQFSYSNIIKVNNDKAGKNSLSIYPIPATATIHLAGTISGNGFTVKIINMAGATVKQYQYNYNPFNQLLQYNIHDIATGAYQLIVMNNEGVILEKLKFMKVD